MQVGDILRKKTARVATVRMNETVGIAAQLMRASNISALVVKDVVETATTGRSRGNADFTFSAFCGPHLKLRSSLVASRNHWRVARTSSVYRPCL